MKNINALTILLGLLCMTQVAWGRPLTPEEAALRIQNSNTAMKIKGREGTLNLKYTVDDNRANAALYVFDRTPGSGFVIASADDEAYPLLG